MRDFARLTSRPTRLGLLAAPHGPFSKLATKALVKGLTFSTTIDLPAGGPQGKSEDQPHAKQIPGRGCHTTSHHRLRCMLAQPCIRHLARPVTAACLQG